MLPGRGRARRASNSRFASPGSTQATTTPGPVSDFSPIVRLHDQSVATPVRPQIRGQSDRGSNRAGVRDPERGRRHEREPRGGPRLRSGRLVDCRARGCHVHVPESGSGPVGSLANQLPHRSKRGASRMLGAPHASTLRERRDCPEGSPEGAERFLGGPSRKWAAASAPERGRPRGLLRQRNGRAPSVREAATCSSSAAGVSGR